MIWFGIYTAAFLVLQFIIYLVALFAANKRGQRYQDMFGERDYDELSEEEISMWEGAEEGHRYGSSGIRKLETFAILVNFPSIVIVNLPGLERVSNYLWMVLLSYVLYLGVTYVLVVRIFQLA